MPVTQLRPPSAAEARTTTSHFRGAHGRVDGTRVPPAAPVSRRLPAFCIKSIQRQFEALLRKLQSFKCAKQAAGDSTLSKHRLATPTPTELETFVDLYYKLISGLKEAYGKGLIKEVQYFKTERNIMFYVRFAQGIKSTVRNIDDNSKRELALRSFFFGLTQPEFESIGGVWDSRLTAATSCAGTRVRQLRLNIQVIHAGLINWMPEPGRRGIYIAQAPGRGQEASVSLSDGRTVSPRGGSSAGGDPVVFSVSGPLRRSSRVAEASSSTAQGGGGDEGEEAGEDAHDVEMEADVRDRTNPSPSGAGGDVGAGVSRQVEGRRRDVGASRARRGHRAGQRRSARRSKAVESL